MKFPVISCFLSVTSVSFLLSFSRGCTIFFSREPRKPPPNWMTMICYCRWRFTFAFGLSKTPWLMCYAQIFRSNYILAFWQTFFFFFASPLFLLLFFLFPSVSVANFLFDLVQKPLFASSLILSSVLRERGTEKYVNFLFYFIFFIPMCIMIYSSRSCFFIVIISAMITPNPPHTVRRYFSAIGFLRSYV